ncbi:MAG: tRNA dihydrouridine(20/20a) synthase DusA [Alphaproteobacteria bacterium]|tara:strand:- start:4284 stop:5267 length:984 start_codon:yes stop_codon:yes gene_type:complete
MKEAINRKFCVAPMMGYTTPYARKLYRILTKESFLFTEMIASKSMIYSKSKDLIIENDEHNPVALQVGGSDLEDLRKCSKIAHQYNYNEINLNVGCPSKAVQKGSFGACLMQDKVLVKECLEVMQNNKIEVSLKCRIGLGKKLNYNFFEEFIDEVVKSGIKIIYVHARNAILTGISPAQNRSIPPLDYSFIRKIKLKYPNILFILNGGIDSLENAKLLLREFDGVMVGRLIQNNPFLLKKVDSYIYNLEDSNNINEKLIFDYFNYINPKIKTESIFRLLSPILQIFFGIPNSKKFKSKIHDYMKNQDLKKIEELFISFIRKNKLLLS